MVTTPCRASARWDSAGLRFQVCVLVGALVLASTLTAAQVPAAGRISRLQVTLETQRQAFLSNDPDRVLAGFAPRQAIFVRLPPLAPAGFFTPGPLRALITQLFTARTTVAFEMPVSGDVIEASDGVAHVRARWQYRAAGSDTLQTELMQMTWRDVAGDGAWLIVELKSTAR